MLETLRGGMPYFRKNSCIKPGIKLMVLTVKKKRKSVLQKLVLWMTAKRQSAFFPVGTDYKNRRDMY